MPERKIRYLGDPILKTPAAPVTRFGKSLHALVDDLMDTVAVPGRAGLAAPQIGVGLRAFSYNMDGRAGYVINPELVEVSDEQQDAAGQEGCLSVPGLYFPTPRAMSATVHGVDLRNEPVVVGGRAEMARCLQHEIDHLDGILYLDRLDAATRKQAMRQVRESAWFLPTGQRVIR
jgi:peptide deformylase